MKKNHLWQINHSYYCSTSNYFSNECEEKFESWEEFIEEEGGADLDYNLLFRWDWYDSKDEDYEIQQDELLLFYIGQRNGLFRSVTVKVKKKDEPAIKSWLKTRYRHLTKLWEPL